VTSERNGIAFIPWFQQGAGRVASQILDPDRARASSHGTSSVNHFEENVAAASLQLNDEEFKNFPTFPD
jgi:aryl-alcohol dehydrogenase-like predicted oxidoreductase